MRLLSPAKLNLFFKVLHKRFDGYHEIASIFGAISLCDTLDLTLSSRDLIECSAPGIPLGDDNLIMKAVHHFRKRHPHPFHVHVYLKKRIPIEAGLGGGSSNAATTLWGLNQLLDAPFSEAELMEMAGEIGADVSFFFSTGCAFCTGFGERVESLPPFPFPRLVVAKPKAALSTAAVYKKTQVAKLPARDVRAVVRSFCEGVPTFFNDLEPAAFTLEPRMAVWKGELHALGFDHVVMTGSGTAFFCIGDVSSPSHPEITFFHTHLIHRQRGKWWELEMI